MEHLLSHTITTVFLFLFLPWPLSATTDLSPSCRRTCGSIQVNYPFGTGHGCGSPRFHPYVTCRRTPSSDGGDSEEHETLVLTTHTGSYPITSIRYDASTITLTPPSMSTCSAMQPSRRNFGLDLAGPFGPAGSSTFVLLACLADATLASPACDRTSHLCASLYTGCPSVASLGLPAFPPTNTCCVYSPASLDRDDELDLRALTCRGFTSVVSLGDYPTDPARWEYGVVLRYNAAVLASSVLETRCRSCELSDGVCGYGTEKDDDNNNVNSFLCVCKGGFNTTTDCFNGFGSAQVEDVFWPAASGFLLPSIATCGILLFFTSSFVLLWG